jgi:hypothetical protein
MPAVPAAPASRKLRTELGEGLAFTWRQPFLRYSAFFAASVNVLLQALSPAAAMTIVAAGMAVTAAAATAVGPVRDAGRRTPGPSGPAAGAAGAAPAAG